MAGRKFSWAAVGAIGTFLAGAAAITAYVDSSARENRVRVEAERQREEIERLRREVIAELEQVLRKDDAAGQSTSATSWERITAMRAIDVSQCPDDFRVGYFNHITAWEDSVRGRAALTQWRSNDHAGKVLAEQFICSLLNCSKSPLDAANERDQQLVGYVESAGVRIRDTWREVERIAVGYGVDPNWKSQRRDTYSIN